MGLRGPVKASPKVIALRGGPPAAPKPAPKPAPMPRCPTELSPEARREWKRVAPELYRSGRLTELDVAALSAYCSSYSLYVRCLETIARDGISVINSRGAIVKHPLISVLTTARRDTVMMAREFGCTPFSRGRVELVDLDPEIDPFDEWSRS